jgi:hypothetical protein
MQAFTPVKPSAPGFTHHFAMMEEPMLCFTSCMQAFTPVKPSASGFTHHFPMVEDIIPFMKGPLLIIMISSKAN